ncbi:MAG: tRNA-dihydrouridine synthase family protein [Gemmataceae bacterium]
MLDPSRPALILAPMEGVTDAAMRAVQGAAGSFSFAVSEFLRVSQDVPPRHVFRRHVPELDHRCLTPNGLPVQVQLLGGNAERMAKSALVACEAGATAIDINFGCPAKTVNRHDGGATLLKFPQRIREIVSAIRSALPASIPVSAKMRLGWDSIEPVCENAAMAAEGGANWIVIHARTRMAGYQPPIFWRAIGEVRRQLSIPVVANGDIWTLDDFRRCREETGCIHFMIGRGALADPRLARQIRRELGMDSFEQTQPNEIDWFVELSRLQEWSLHYLGSNPGGLVRRMKQWLKLAAQQGTFPGFDAIKESTSPDELLNTLRQLQLADGPATISSTRTAASTATEMTALT